MAAEIRSSFKSRFLYNAVVHDHQLMKDWVSLQDKLACDASCESETSYLSMAPMARFWRQLLNSSPELIDFLSFTDAETRHHFEEFVTVLYRDYFLKKHLESYSIYNVLNWQDRASIAHWLAGACEEDIAFFSNLVARMYDSQNGEAGALLRSKVGGGLRWHKISIVFMLLYHDQTQFTTCCVPLSAI